MVKMIENAERINNTPSLQPRGPFPLINQVAMALTVDIIQESLHTVRRI